MVNASVYCTQGYQLSKSATQHRTQNKEKSENKSQNQSREEKNPNPGDDKLKVFAPWLNC